MQHVKPRCYPTLLTGSAWGDWALYTASPLRASTQDVLLKGGSGSVYGDGGGFSAPASSASPSAPVSSGELGVQQPVGYWDPLGLNNGADAATFARRRTVEIKHGRVAMWLRCRWPFLLTTYVHILCFVLHSYVLPWFSLLTSCDSC
jgi:hypothetical protein